MPLVAGVDSSTGSTKVELRDPDSGAVVGRGSAAHPPTTPPRSEQDPAAWWAAFQQAWAAAWTSASRPPGELGAISIAAQQHGMVAIDAGGAVLRPAKLWNDTETAPDAGWLLRQLEGGAAAWADAVGSVPAASFTIAKLSWLHRSEPDAWAQLARVLLPHDWLTWQLLREGDPHAEPVTDRGDASGTGYWSPATGEYRADVLAIVDRERDWTGVVPRVAAPAETVGTWRGAALACGTGDNMAAALGLGLGRGQVLVSLGTSGTACTVADAPVADPTGAVAGFADATGRFLPLVCTLNATKVLDAAARLLGVDQAAFDALALAGVPGAGGLVLLPYLDGERTPDLPKATGWVTGLRSDVSREQFARAVVEGVVCGLLDAVDALRRVAPVDQVVLAGGGARSAAVREVFASLSTLPVVRVDTGEAVAAGAAVQAAAALGGAHADVARGWGLDRNAGPALGATYAGEVAEDVRGRFAALRAHAYPSTV